MSLRRPAKEQPENFEFNSSSLDAAKTIISNYPEGKQQSAVMALLYICLLYTSPSPRDRQKSRMPSSA